ncbi:hypothetical protein COCSADRAFT_181035 [Bipolaris sorokiniana ND90Pr]|uniref:Uncharacterized protein n=1 Tax=Cochliobolus sativus (strain ND90Pr / ATCC 201652) TaxID=665912 RepID=M2T814_COCSN|nr:uncharacterized protein COCSADRAFT_181035 [Bipolaris sorokiniana ND90Pr]EMD65077.1 hypothetical protein COCSADRAFT_181035 [Bipolaris sorokiniana ND90Pr]
MARANSASSFTPAVTPTSEICSSGIHRVPAVAPTEDPPAQGLVVAVPTLSITSTTTVEPAILTPVNTPASNSLEYALVARVGPAAVVPPPPIVNPVVNPVPPAPAPAPTSSVSSRTTSTSVTHAMTSFSNMPFVTVQWVETFVGGTYSTWWPHTISIDFKPQRSVAPAPGRGEIGMGTLTGKTGQTQTVVEVVAAAPTHDSGWAKGVAAMVGVGIMGIF